MGVSRLAHGMSTLSTVPDISPRFDFGIADRGCAELADPRLVLLSKKDFLQPDRRPKQMRLKLFYSVSN